MSRSVLLRAGHVSALFALSVAQPLLDLLGRNPAFFVARAAPPADVILLLLVLALGVPALLLALEWAAARLGERAADLVHLLLVGVFASLLALLFIRRGLDGSAALAAAGAAGALAVLVYARFAAVRTFLTVLSPAPLLVVLLFALQPGIPSVLLPERPALVADVHVGNPAPIVFVVFDEFNLLTLLDENEQIDAKRYPSFGELASQSTWFRNATSMSFHSETAVPAILTGRLPRERNVPQSLAEYPQNVFTLLGGAYQIIAYESLTRLCPKDVCKSTLPLPPRTERLAALFDDVRIVYGHVILPPSLTRNLPAIDTRWLGFGGEAPNPGAEGVPEAAAGWRKPPGAKAREVPNIREVVNINRSLLFSRFLESIRSPGVPTLYFLHILVPHTDWRFLPSGREYAGNEMEGVGRNGVWDDDEWAVLQGAQRHMLQVGFADHLLGLLIATLKDLDLYDRSLVVVAADHGASTVPGEPRRSLGEKGYPELMLVPFFVKAPRQQQAAIIDRNVEIIDILPTLADVLHVEIPWPVDGTSGFATDKPERPEKRFLATDGWRTYPKELPGREWSLQRLIERFGTGATRPVGPWGIGPYADLVGKAAPAEAPTRADVAVRLNAQRFANVQRDVTVPAHISGSAQWSDDEGPLDIAVAVNGTIAGVTRARRSTTSLGSAFTAMLLDSTMRDGSNTVEPFVIESVNGEVKLFRPGGVARGPGPRPRRERPPSSPSGS